MSVEKRYLGGMIRIVLETPEERKQVKQAVQVRLARKDKTIEEILEAGETLRAYERLARLPLERTYFGPFLVRPFRMPKL